MNPPYGEIGTTGTATCLCTPANTAKTLKSGSLNVFATPAMVALMEEAACNALNIVSSNSTSVGIEMNLKHLAATSLGRTIIATATITNIQQRTIHFTVEAKDSTGSTIGTGKHSRAIVEIEKFMTKAIAKKDQVGKL